MNAGQGSQLPPISTSEPSGDRPHAGEERNGCRLPAPHPNVWRWRIVVSLVVNLVGPAGVRCAEPTDFEAAANIIVRRCLECHSARDTSGGFNLTTRATAFAGGDSGAAIRPGDVAESPIVQRVRDGEMPPPLKGIERPLPAEEVEVIERWVAAGANWPDERILDLYERTSDVRGGRDFWSLQPVERPIPPPVRAVDAVANPIDSFVIARLEAAGMEAAPRADRATLIRRVTFDLAGLPPTADEIDAFVSDPDPLAYENLVDRLLASPRFGQRWARRWLDLARYADTCGYERDQEKPGAWRYRDWVVDAANSDLPYDRFVVEQLAGDELPDRDISTVVATGFLRLGTWNDEPNDPEEYKYDRLEDMVNATCTAFIGMTVKCARCHDHKFDPIPQVDYYKVASAFWAGPIDARERELLGGPSKDELGYDVLGWTDLTPRPPTLHVLKKGDPKHPLEVVQPGSPTLVAALARFDEPPQAGSSTSQRRLQLACWIADPRNPLTPRVFVNRLWQSHFGEGLVRSVDNFGFTGDQPTHPLLLDWLADEFVRSGWSPKRIQRLIVTSRTYQQSSLHPRAADYEANDAGNLLLWHVERHRLDAEQIRDRILAVSESLDSRMAGPSFKPTVSADALEGLSRKGAAWTPSPPAEQRRRSLYSYSQRSLLPPLMTTFDFGDTTLPCGRRETSTVAPQALALMNNEFVHAQSDQLATIVAERAGDDPSIRIETAWRLALGRAPSATERAAAADHLRSQSLRFARLPHEAPDGPERLEQNGLVLHLDAAEGVDTDEAGRVARWRDLSGDEHDASQADAARRPQRVDDGINGHPSLRFDGTGQFLELAGQVVSSQKFTVMAVVKDVGTAPGHRTLFSNWNGRAGNSVTSLFLGTTGADAVRLSDDFAGVGRVVKPQSAFLLTGLASEREALVFQNDVELARKSTPLAPRRLMTPFVLGQQGNINGEYWNGDLAELLVYDRALADDERDATARVLARRYGLWSEPTVPRKPPDLLALESLCHVLLNCNEFVYVD